MAAITDRKRPLVALRPILDWLHYRLVTAAPSAAYEEAESGSAWDEMVEEWRECSLQEPFNVGVVDWQTPGGRNLGTTDPHCFPV